jgi:ubiquinone/menaquinone biosynthesis C-methylase UbiE
MSPKPAADPTARFSSRVADYAAHRPRYPETLYQFMREHLGVDRGRAVVDVGSGTGIFAEPLLEIGCTLYCVEPNGPMREEAERALRPRFSSFNSVNGTADATTLPDRCADLATAAQAFHWFDAGRFRDECRRLLRPGGRAALVWNSRKVGGTPFLEAYEALLNELGTDYAAVRHDRADPDRLRQFFPAGFERVAFPNAQHLDQAGLRGRLLSSSYTPGPDDPRRPAMLAALSRLFERHQYAGTVSIDYDTELYFGAP